MLAAAGASKHCRLTCVRCRLRDCVRRVGCSFTAVHDSYWTHAADIDAMNASLRDQFIRLYSLPLLEDLRAGLSMRFPGVQFPELPPRGDLDLAMVRQAKFFFS